MDALIGRKIVKIMKMADAMFLCRRRATEAMTGAVRQVSIDFGFVEAARGSGAKIVVATGCSSAIQRGGMPMKRAWTMKSSPSGTTISEFPGNPQSADMRPCHAGEPAAMNR